jgi:hypothetical protein
VWEQPNGLLKRHFGQVTGSEVLEANCKAEEDARFDTLRYVINDFLDCTGVSVSPNEIEEIAAIDHGAATSNPNIRVAIVATHPDVLAASTAYVTDPLCAFATRIFNSMDDARSWLRPRHSQT